MVTSAFDLASRVRAALVHLGLSAVVAALVAGLVFALWYPTPFREISGGRELFLLLVVVDVLMGPLITFAVFDRRKPRSELVRDLAVIVALQVAALIYGLYTVAQARPVVVALEGDRLRVVRAIDLADADLDLAPDGLRKVSWTGVRFVATRPPTAAEKLDATDRGLAGEDIGMRPAFWRSVQDTAPAYAKAAKPIAQLLGRVPKAVEVINGAANTTGRRLDQLGYLPILARSTDWSALVDLKDGSIVGYVPVDGF